jgi:hypothetical protein
MKKQPVEQKLWHGLIHSLLHKMVVLHLQLFKSLEGVGAMNVHRTSALAQIQQLHWKSELLVTFKEFSLKLKKAYDVLSEEEPYSDLFKVQELVGKMNPMSKQGSIDSVKETIMRENADDFVGAIYYALNRITDIY